MKGLLSSHGLIVIFISGTLCAHAQTKSMPPFLPTVERDHVAEQKVTDALFRELRERGGMIPKLTAPSDLALQMTCSTAVDWDRDKDAEAFGVKIAQADVANFPQLLNGLATSVLATKDEPGIWIVVFRTTDAEGVQTLTLGYSMLESKLNHIKGCFLTEDGCDDRTWQRSVAPACRRFRH